MTKYKLTVKYSDVCELSIAGDIPGIIQNEFDQYVKSILYKKEEWENFETNFKEAARLEYGDTKRKKNEENVEAVEKDEENITEDDNENVNDQNINNIITEEKTDDKTVEKAEDEPFESKEELKEKDEDSCLEADTKEPEKCKKARAELISFAKYVQGKRISTPLDEFVAGACYLDEILNIKEFSLKQINAKLYPVFKRLASSIVIKQATDRVLIETIKDNEHIRYSINQNAWNYHNYDLVGQS